MKSLYLVLAMLASQSVFATCNYAFPEQPTVPDGKHASLEEMHQAQTAVQAYMKEAETRLACISEPMLHNALVTQMHKLADTYNGALRTYRERLAAL